MLKLFKNQMTEIPIVHLKIVQDVVKVFVHGIEGDPDIPNPEKKKRVIKEADYLLEEMGYEIPPIVLETAVEASVKTMRSLARLSQT